MQQTFSCVDAARLKIEETLSVPRVNRYLSAVGGDRRRLLAFYLWNSRLCEAFYFPCQTAEVAVRNRLNVALASQFEENWHDNPAFISPLPNRLKSQLEEVKRSKQSEHGASMTVNHVVSGLTLGFWCHILTSNYEQNLWRNGMTVAFPHLPFGHTRQNVYDCVDKLRDWRNRIAHHGVIFDKQPLDQAKNVQQILAWICKDTAWFIEETSNITRVMSFKPPKKGPRQMGKKKIGTPLTTEVV